MAAKLQVAVLGATGYSGLELTRLLVRHPRVGEPLLLRRSEDRQETPPHLSDVFPSLSGNGSYPLHPFSWEVARQRGIELLFLATPHQVSRALVPEALARGVRVVDLSGAWRLKQAAYREIYSFKDEDARRAAETAEKAVYGLPELHPDRIRDATLIANPGCYATSVILALAPILRAGYVAREHGIIADAKSGVSGAGKEPSSRTHFVSVADNVSPYAVFTHRHLGEMAEQLALAAGELTFTPHLLPIPRGILSTIYVKLQRPLAEREISSCYRDFYRGRRFVRVFETPLLPEIHFSLHSNYCDLGFCLAPDRERLVIVSCLDNLMKGAAGQAVQNMNGMYGWSELEGLA
jgi:N-acetyl-gamma-glutamyl-phosphate reductase